MRQGWASLDFREEKQVARLRKLWESLELEILSVLEATNRLRASPEFELYELTAKKPEMHDSVVAKQTALLEKEISSLASEAERLGREIGELTGRTGNLRLPECVASAFTARTSPDSKSRAGRARF